MQDNPSVGHMLMSLSVIIFLSVIGQAVTDISWLDAYRIIAAAASALVLSRVFAAFNS